MSESTKRPAEEELEAPAPKRTRAEWVTIFNKLGQSELQHIHQRSGWTDIDDPEVWYRYVLDVVNGHVASGMSIFEVGMGLGGFLSVFHRTYDDIVLGGVDGAEASVAEAARLFPQFADNFKVGFAPAALESIPSASYDVVVSHSVFQYISKEDGLSTIREMLRIAKPEGVVILGDVCDGELDAEIQEIMQSKYSRNDFNGDKAPDYTTYFAAEFEAFAGGEDNTIVTTRRVDVEEYHRRKYRYCAYFKKNGGAAAASDAVAAAAAPAAAAEAE